MAKVYYIIQGDICYYTNQEGREDYSEFSPGLEPSSGKNVIVKLYHDKFILPEDCTRLFYGATNTTFNNTDVWDASGVKSMSGMFYQCENLFSIDMSGWDVSLLEDTEYMFAFDHTLKYVDMHGWVPSRLSSTKGMFITCDHLTEIDVDADTDWTRYGRLGREQTFYTFSECISLPGYTEALESLETSQARYLNNTTNIGLFKYYPISYKIRWLIDGNIVYHEEYVDRGVTPTPPVNTPTKEPSGGYKYIFDHWSPTIVAAVSDTDYFAVFDQITYEIYNITFKNINNVVLQTIQVVNGDTPVYSGPDPAGELPDDYDVYHSYTFTGGSPSIVAATTDATYTAQYNVTDAYYDVKYYNYNGNLLYSTNVKAGTVVEYPYETPTKPADQRCTYTFYRGRDPKGRMTSGSSTFYDVDYEPVFNETYNRYTVTFNMGGYGTQIEPKTITGGNPVTKPPTPWDDVNDTMVFDNGYSNSTKTTLYDFDLPIYDNTTLYGKGLDWYSSGNGVFIKIDGNGYKISGFRLKYGKVEF